MCQMTNDVAFNKKFMPTISNMYRYGVFLMPATWDECVSLPHCKGLFYNILK